MVPGACENLVGGAVAQAADVPVWETADLTRAPASAAFPLSAQSSSGECHDAAKGEEVSHE
jgi:hypothetical protein